MAEEDKNVGATSTGDQEEGELSPNKDAAPEKHHLEHKWTLWYNSGSSGKQQANTWGSTLRAVYSFDTVEDFWCLYNNIKQPSMLGQGSDFHLFKAGIEPKWEDPRNAQGGTWTINVPKGNKQLLDTWWLHSLMACIGEHFTEGDDICGIVINLRGKGDRLGMWTKTAANEAAQVQIAKQLKKVLDLDDSQKIGFMAHEDAKASRSAKEKYII